MHGEDGGEPTIRIIEKRTNGIGACAKCTGPVFLSRDFYICYYAESKLYIIGGYENE